MCAHQRQRCLLTKDGSREDDEDNEVEEIGSPRKRKWVSTDKGSRDKKGKKMTEADWEAETRWRDWVEARLGSMDLVLRKIAVCLEGIEEMMEERWYAKETEETEEMEEKWDVDVDADGEEEAEVEDKMVE